MRKRSPLFLYVYCTDSIFHDISVPLKWDELNN